jgi:hypothetical protein
MEYEKGYKSDEDEVDVMSDGDQSYNEDDYDNDNNNNNNNNSNNNKGMQNSNDVVSTDGIPQYMFDDIMDKNLRNSLGHCIFCTKYYSEDMLVPEDKNKERQCYHCLFWMNYSTESRKLVDGKYGMLIVDYILKCKDIHIVADCTRNSDSGGCYLCEYSVGLIPTDVKESNKLSNNFADGVGSYNEDDDVDFDDRHQNASEEYVVEI